jgi:hypothetical protein
MISKIQLHKKRAGEILIEVAGSERNFYSLLNKVNSQLEKEGIQPLSEDGFVDVIESIGWAL